MDKNDIVDHMAGTSLSIEEHAKQLSVSEDEIRQAIEGELFECVRCNYWSAEEDDLYTVDDEYVCGDCVTPEEKAADS